MTSDSDETDTLGDRVVDASIAMDADRFMRTMIRDLSGTLQDTIGEKNARGFVSVVGARMGDRFNELYRRALGETRLSRITVARVLVDLKRRIGGDFYIIEESDEKIVLGNRACPFGAHVKDRPSLCMMTSNVFGRVAAENLGYAKVNIEKSIAAGNDGCRVVVYLNYHGEAESAVGHEYFRVEDS
ncbi:MAG: methanogen output domain 1-containing protein [Rhodospirillaceae bacterium]|nr:methanogen output domain 1-containing protein [Rhodospirillaceae bacterium]